MHPALSVIFFTTLSGTGYGMLAWLGLSAAIAPPAWPRGVVLAAFGVALLLVTVGLLCSVGHLGKPLRAWRAFSQWRSSWLSREGVAAVLTYVPALALAWLWWRGDVGIAAQMAGVALVVLALATVACTAMLYVSLPPIAAWRHRLVLPGYLGLSLLGGAWMLSWFLGLAAMPSPRGDIVLGILLCLGGLALLALKLRYWRDIDAAPYASTAEDATGLGRFGRVRSFEAPHTENNYLLREMGFVLARRHAARLRRIALVLMFVLPPLALACALAWPATRVLPLAIAALLFQIGLFVERWLFFAQARHTVALYYRAGES